MSGPGILRAMVLAAGFGSRMQKAGEARPKPLVELAGAPLIQYAVLAVKRAGFEEVVINLHHRADEIQKALGSGEQLGIRINWLYEPEILGTGGGVKNADRVYPADGWLTINADTVTDLSLKNLVYFHQRFKPVASMVLAGSDGNFNPVYADALGRVRKIGNFPAVVPEDVTLSKFAFCGIQIVSRRLLDYLPDGFARMIEDGYFKALANGDTVLGNIFNRLWLTFDDPQSIPAAEQNYAKTLERLLK